MFRSLAAVANAKSNANAKAGKKVSGAEVFEFSVSKIFFMDQ